MPLIEVKDFATTVQFQEHLIQITIPDLIDTWEESMPYQIFINRYKLKLIETSTAMVFKDNIGEEVERRLTQYIYGLYDYSCRIGEHFTFEEFFSSETIFFSQEGKPLYSAEQIIRLESYFDFLYRNQNKLIRIYNIATIYDVHVEKLRLRLKYFYKSNDLNLFQLDEQFLKLFTTLDNFYELFEKSFKAESEEKVVQKEDLLFIDWVYLKKPFQLEDDCADVITFVSALKGYLKEALYQRKVFLQWHKTPNTYLIVDYFIEELKDEIELLKASQQTKFDAAENKITTIENYPRSIFVSQKYYNFFCLLADQVTSLKQLSFIFRQMSEKEEPKMIVVKDKQFRDWFNDQPFYIKLDEATSTYPNAKNEDRLWAYNTAKNLYFNES
jgi:hypothetical protein